MTNILSAVRIACVLMSVCCLGLSQHSTAQGTQDNAELQQMADEDQRARMQSPIDWTILNREDSLRRQRVFELIAEQKVNTAKDHLNAGIVFQHGNDTIASAMAVKSFETAIKLDPNTNRWWYAAAVDRDLMRRKQPQIYGTQFVQEGDTKWRRYTIDTTKISDEQRRYYSVETLSEQLEKEYLMNLKPLADYYKKTNSVDKTIEQIKTEFKRGRLSAQSLDAEVNKLGYELLTKHKEQDALKIFKLNTELYPKSFNAFDSYGECLLQLGKKKEALKAYKKSLQLNPENDNARKILEQHKKT